MDDKRVISSIVENDLCIGCGVCAGSCPSGNLRIGWKDNGDRAPEMFGQCPSRCQICLQVCPFGINGNSESTLSKSRFENNENINSCQPLGYYINTYVGYSLHEGQRENGSSGGMATWLLETLLGEGRVDAVVCVMPTGRPEQLFTYRIINCIEDVRRAAGSRYYPVDMADALCEIMAGENDRQFAVVGLPCYLKGLHLAMVRIPRLRQRVRYTIGLTCGHLPNRFYTQYLTRVSGSSLGRACSVNYRNKAGTRRAGDYLFKVESGKGPAGQGVPFSRISSIWHNGYFRMNACNYCDDIFCEVADIALMDAWLPEYECDPKGHSLLVVRHPDMEGLLASGKQNHGCHLDSISKKKILQSQQGVIHNKRVMLSGRLFRAKKMSVPTPDKRVQADGRIYKQFRWQIDIKLKIQQASKSLWPHYVHKPIKLFNRNFFLMSLPLVFIRISARIKRVISKPALLLRLIKR